MFKKSPRTTIWEAFESSILLISIFSNMIMPLHRRAVTPVYIRCLVTPVYPNQCILASGVDQTQDPSIGSPACYHWVLGGPANLLGMQSPSAYIKLNFIAQAITSPCTLLEWRTQLRWICDVIRHNFKWNICDVMKQKDLKQFLWCDIEFLYKNSDVLKNKQVSTFLRENLMKSRSRESFGQNLTQVPYFHSLRLT